MALVALNTGVRTSAAFFHSFLSSIMAVDDAINGS